VLKGFWHDLIGLLWGHRKGLLLFGGVTLAVILLFTGWLAHESEKPEFCRTCHIMEPYYQSWKSSSHNTVNCLLCHFKPGWRGFIRGKIVALSQFTRYITVTYGSKPWAEIEDANCLRVGCHERELLKGPLEFQKGVLFDHSHHLADLRRGKQLRCTSCHSQIVQGAHITVTESVCFVCHFKPEPDGTRNAILTDCRKCHRKGMISPHTPAEHALFIDRATDCTKCHISVTQGDGAVHRERCESCHADPQHLQTADSEALHWNHVAMHKVECFQCHDPIGHKLETAQEILQADCSVCHTERHQLQKAFYRGASTLPFAISLPSPMIEAHINCTACHAEMEKLTSESLVAIPGAVARASSKACKDCHEPGYDRLLEQWQHEVERRIGQTRVMARIANSASSPTTTVSKYASSTSPSAVAAVADAVDQTLDLINRANAVHNIGFTAVLIEHCQRALLDAASTTSVGPVLGAWVADEMQSFHQAPSCLQRCHYGVSQRTIRVKNQNRLFPHSPHINQARLDCGVCHSRDQHKVNLPRGHDCDSCHHSDVQGKQCADCHQNIIAFAEGKLAGLNLPAAQNTDCESCHSGIGGQIVWLNSNSCGKCHSDDKAYMAKMNQELEELGQLSVEVDEAIKAHLDRLDLKGLQIAEQVRLVSRVNGIHNFGLAKRIYQAARDYFSTPKTSGSASH